MKTSVGMALIILGAGMLTSCGSSEQASTSASTSEGMTVPKSDEWTAKPEGGVDVTLPQTPVTTQPPTTTETATPVTGPGTGPTGAPTAGQPDKAPAATP
ncbi:hypothetical protein NT2_05_01700 [Caenibius tardaugens NBRC 16725]|uniref:Uncharacterized protein n=1 Tax=Caenibius tardaugens NBRC 16725 TaxID=1219035 RepID=U2YKY8_9SPHN|nr:hypothetical protein [Caenibius tardaugens]AZI36599.1 hypothetical protein EGO55_12080 [Caenibius tardaugens NBRC 16725]GAD49250.1 hypothetical protein NT2_05_01700 [Caenibius tardaugens NBRC 16725]